MGLHTYYRLPLAPGQLMKRQKLEKCPLDESIRQHIHLILKTHFGENRFDPQYGCLIWDYDFENIESISRWKDYLEDLITHSLCQYELRLTRQKTIIQIDEPEIIHPDTRKYSKPYKRIRIDISGTILQTDVGFFHQELMFLSPLSLG